MRVQEYLRSGKTLVDLTSEFAIKSNLDAAGTLVCLNYSMYGSDLSEHICQECRALILEVGSWDVISKSFHKFFNYGEGDAPEIDWHTARVQEKLDGSLISIYHYDGWRIASRGMCDASGNVGSSTITFRELVIQAIDDMGYSAEQFFGLLDPTMSYSFELTAPENRVIVEYAHRKLTLLAVWDLVTLEEITLETLGLPFPTIQTVPVTIKTFEELTSLAAALDPFRDEGYVVVDIHRNRVKVKNPLYVAVASAVAGLQGDRQIAEAAINPAIDDLLPMLPASVSAQVNEARERFRRLFARILSEYESIRHHESQRDFARDALLLTWPAALFDLRKGSQIEDVVKRMSGDAIYGVYSKFRTSEETD